MQYAKHSTFNMLTASDHNMIKSLSWLPNPHIINMLTATDSSKSETGLD